MIIFLVILFGSLLPTFIYLLATWWLDRYEKEPVWLLILSFFWGAVPAIILSLIFEILLDMPVSSFLGQTFVSTLFSGSVNAPVVEETFKALALLCLVLIFHREFDDELDGLVYGAMIGFGFALTENIFYFFSVMSKGGFGAGIFNIFMRTFIFGFNHAFWTAIIGATIGYARLSKGFSKRILVPFSGWLLAIVLHGIHNAGVLVVQQTFCLSFCIILTVNWGGLALIISVAILILKKESRWIKEQLSDEVKKGELSEYDYNLLSSSSRRMNLRWKVLTKSGFRGYRNLGKFFQSATELAFKKQHLETDKIKDEVIEKLRNKFIENKEKAEKYLKY